MRERFSGLDSKGVRDASVPEGRREDGRCAFESSWGTRGKGVVLVVLLGLVWLVGVMVIMPILAMVGCVSRAIRGAKG